MKSVKPILLNTCLSLLFAAWTPFLQADEVSGDYVREWFRITNLRQFPGYQFCFTQYSQEEVGDTIVIEENEIYYSASEGRARREGTYLFARSKENPAGLFQCDIVVGDLRFVENYTTNKIIQEYEIVSLDSGRLVIKPGKSFIVKQGQTREREYDGGTFSSGKRWPWPVWVAPAISFLLLLWLFIRRYKKYNKQLYTNPS